MRSMRKFISVILTAVMIMTCMSLCFPAFAASTAGQISALAEAIATEGVKKAEYSGEGAVTVTDTTGEVIKAADAYMTVFNADRPTGNIANNAKIRTSSQLNDAIKTKVQAEMGSEKFAEYNANSFFAAMNGNITVDSSTDSKNQLTVPEIKLTVTIADDAAFAAYNTIDEMPNEVTKQVVFTVTHKNNSYNANTSGCGSADNRYFLVISANMSRTVTQKIAKAPLLNAKNVFDTYSEFFGYELADCIALGTEACNAAINDLNTAFEAVSAGIFIKFFSEYANVIDVINMIQVSLEVGEYAELVETISELSEVDYSNYTKEQIEDLYNTYSTIYTTLSTSAATVKEYFGINEEKLAFYNSKLTEFNKAYQIAELKAYKENTFDPAIQKYSAINEDTVLSGEATTEDLVAGVAEIKGYLKALQSYDAAYVAEVFGENFSAETEALFVRLDELMDVIEADKAFAAKYAYYISTVYEAVNLEDSSEDLLAAVKEYDEWYAGLVEFEAELEAQFGKETAQKIFDGLDAEMRNMVGAKYDILNSRITAQINTAIDLLEKVINVYGSEVTIVSASTYTKLDNAINVIDVDTLEFLETTENFELAEDIRPKYERLKEVVLDDFRAYCETAGLDQFETKTVKDFIRKAEENAKVRNEDFATSDEMIEEVLDRLDKMLLSDEFVTFGAHVKDVISPNLLNGIYSDSLINTVMQFLYPLVAEEFAKVWAGLPEEVDVDNPVGSGQITVKLSIFEIEKAMNNVKLYLFPGILGEHIRDEYPEVADKLALATTKAVYHLDTKTMDNPWKDAAICNEDGKLDLHWGVDEAEDKQEAFLNAAQAALSGLEPILLALLANKGISGIHNDEENAADGMPGHGDVGKGSTSVKIIVNIPVSVTPINLFLDFAPNSGYNNALVPVFEALGLKAEDIPDGNTFESTKDFVKRGLLEPLTALINEFNSAPLNFLVNLFPNLAYVLDACRVVPTLSMIKTAITYHADAHYTAAGLVPGDVKEALKGGPIDINVGQMLNLESLGIDLTSFNALLQMLGGLIGDITLPPINSSELAMMGELVWRDTERNEKTYNYGPADKAAYIKANRADVFMFALGYFINILKVQPDFIERLVDRINNYDPNDETKSPTVLPGLVLDILHNLVNGYDYSQSRFDAAAAFLELVYPKEYTTKAPEYKMSLDTIDADYKITDLHTGETKYVVESDTEYTKYWTEEKSEYVAKHLPEFIDNILMMFGVKVNGEMVGGLGEVVDNAVESLYKAETVNKIAATLGGLLDNLSMADNVRGFLQMILDDILDDSSVWKDYKADFEDGDKEAFKAALSEVLAPVANLLRFILADEDISLSLHDENGEFLLAEAKGYGGYKYGLIPLLETLGAKTVLTEEEFIADKANIVNNIITPVLEIVDNISADPYTQVQELIPNLMLFLASDGLHVAMDNLLYAVNQLLETIKPVYDVNISELVGVDVSFAGIDPITFIMTEVAAAIEKATGISFDLDFTTAGLLDQFSFGDVVEYTSATGDTAYRISANTENSAAMTTELLRFVLGEVLFSENTEKLLNLARDKFDLPDEVYYPLYGVLFGMYYMKDTHIDYALGVLYWAFYGVDTAVDHVAPYYKFMSYDWQEMVENLKDENTSNADKALYVFKEVYDKTAMTIVDELYEQGKVPINSSVINQFIELAKRLMNFFKNVLAMFGK